MIFESAFLAAFTMLLIVFLFGALFGGVTTVISLWFRQR